jgi:hypothetical protein
MNSWVFTIPFTFLLAAVLLWLVLRAGLRADVDDGEGPAARHFLDEDACPERDEAHGSRCVLRWPAERACPMRVWHLRSLVSGGPMSSVPRPMPERRWPAPAPARRT